MIFSCSRLHPLRPHEKDERETLSAGLLANVSLGHTSTAYPPHQGEHTPEQKEHRSAHRNATSYAFAADVLNECDLLGIRIFGVLWFGKLFRELVKLGL